MDPITLALAAALGARSTTSPGIVENRAADRRRSRAIDVSTDAAMTKLFARVAGSLELVAKA